MSREIKYRVWDENEGEYRTDYENMVLYPDGTFQIETSWCIISGEFVVEQYTGLKDKNGKEIYEGDICKDQRGYVGKIVWAPNEAGFGFYEYHVRDDGFGLGCMPLSRLRLEILGNIHENPELMESRL